MWKENIVLDKSKLFAVRIVKLCKYLADEKKEFILSKQILRSGTSIGANITESEYSISDKEFLSKIYIAYKETGETLYWLDLLHDTEYLTNTMYESLNRDCSELLKLLASITKTVREKTEEK